MDNRRSQPRSRAIGFGKWHPELQARDFDEGWVAPVWGRRSVSTLIYPPRYMTTKQQKQTKFILPSAGRVTTYYDKPNMDPFASKEAREDFYYEMIFNPGAYNERMKKYAARIKKVR